MARSSGRQRAKALVLLLVLFAGGFGLPIVDGLWFHSKAISHMAAEDQVATTQDSGKAHLLGCAVWSSPAASTGLPEVVDPVVTVAVTIAAPAAHIPAIGLARQVPALSLARAPPSV